MKRKTILLICSIVFIVFFVILDLRLTKDRVSFMTQYIPIEAAESIIKWTDYYYISEHWLSVFSLLMTESNGKRKAKSLANCKGYMQISRTVYEIAFNRFQGKIKSRGIYDSDFNIASGILHLKNLSKWYDLKWIEVIEVYNLGYRYWLKGRRATKHLKRYNLNYTFYYYEWRRFNDVE